MTLFYFVETRTDEQRPLLCQWVEYYYESGKRVQVVADSTLAAQHLDQLLWTFSQPSFVPHRIGASSNPAGGIEPVVITIGEMRLDGFDVLISDGPPTQLEISRLYPVAVHFVLRDDEERRQQSRLLWQKARELGFEPRHVPYASNAKPPALPGP